MHQRNFFKSLLTLNMYCVTKDNRGAPSGNFLEASEISVVFALNKSYLYRGKKKPEKKKIHLKD